MPTGLALSSPGFQKRSLQKPWLVLLKSQSPSQSIHVPSPQPVALPLTLVPSHLLAQVTFARRLLASGFWASSILSPSLLLPLGNGLVWCRLVLFSALLPVQTGQDRTGQDATVLGTITQHLGALSIITISFHFSFVLFYPDSISILDP